MTVNELIEKLNDLANSGKGNCKVYVGGKIGFGEYAVGEDLEIVTDEDCMIKVDSFQFAFTDEDD